MKSIFALAPLALALPFSVAFAQPPPAAEPPRRDDMQEAGKDAMRDDKDHAMHADKEKIKQDPHAMQGSGPPTFDMLNGHEKGHVTLAEVQRNSWLATNFMTCDKDKDNKVTEAEYDGCQPIK